MGEGLGERVYPLLFQPNLHTVVWGGNRLRPYKGLLPTDDPVGESWEVSAVPSSTSIVSNGPLAGQDLISVVNRYGAELLGEAVCQQYGGQLPLLVKFIDAADDLSIQVHPNDDLARRRHNKNGKSECWYIIDAKPGSYLYAGLKQHITPCEYQQRVADGSITQVLARHKVKPGDVFYLPAGRIHAICGGILLAEVQQSSDVTYRIFDYNRPGLDGKPRQLHTDLALDAIDFHVEDEYGTRYDETINRANPCVNSPYFKVRIVNTTGPFHRDLIKYDSFIITMCIQGDCDIRIRQTGDTIRLLEGHTALIPALIADYDIIPRNPSGKTRLLDAYIDNKSRSLASRVTRFLHITKK
ncbi:MAG: class I mannose-6-phosphate isomerase [Bacteroidaceae bacterium]|nr:class I mannose-6-phosphate isomerase [Bacteroidaceae bacterium]